jgi:amidase
MDDVDLCYVTARKALELFSSRSLSPLELLEAVLRRIEQVNPRVNALGDCYFEAAQRAACEAETRWRRGTARALEGIPVAVKDAQNLAGTRTTYGSPVYRDNIAETSDPMIERLVAAGAIIHARTTVSEFCLSGVCHSQMWGTTFNPWNTDFSPGGSSGGSGAALAAGLTLLATGTDMGGSIRVPASACGVVGYKAPHGRNPDGQPSNADRLNHCGPLARSVGDIALVQSIIAGQHRGDHDSLRETVAYPHAAEDISGMRVAWSPDLSYRAVHADVRSNTEQAVARLRDLGCRVERVDLGWSDEIDAIASDWYGAGPVGRMLLMAVTKAPALVPRELQRLAEIWRSRQGGVAHVLDLIGGMWHGFGRIMEAHDIFVCPTMSIAAVKANQSMWDAEFEIDGKRVDPEFGYSMTHQFNLLGNCPAISVPSGRDRFGVPTGLQIVGRPFDDETVIRAAWAFEAAGEAWCSRPDLRPRL